MGCLVLLSLLVRATQIPNFKWSQTNESISITAYYDPSKIVRLKGQADIKMKNQDFTPVTKDHSFEKEWLHLSWNDFKLDLHLREDIVPKDSWCKWKEQFVVCKLQKVHHHVFDFLSTRDQVKQLKRYGTLDWEATTVGDQMETFEFDESIPVLTVKQIEKMKKKKLIVRAFYPWCSKCKDEQESFEAARKDKTMRKKKFKFGVVDAREDRETGKYMGVSCSDSCNFYAYVKGKKYTIKGKKKKKEFVEEVILEIEDPFVKIKKQERLNKLKKKNTVVAGYFEDESTDAYKFWLGAAKEMKRRKEVVFALLPKENPNWAKALTNGANRVVLFNKKRKQYQETFTTQKNFTSWVEVYSSAPFEKYTYDLKKKYTDIGSELPVLKVFLSDDKPAKKLKRQLTSLAEEYREKMVFLWYPDSQDHQMKDLGLHKDDKPSFGISSTFKEDEAKHYGSTKPVNVENIRQQIEWYFEGKADQTYKTQKNPYLKKNETEQWKLGEVQEIVQVTFEEEVIQSDLDVALLLYKNWTTHKDSAFDQMYAAAKICKDIDTLKYAKYDYHENWFDLEKYGIKKHSSDLVLLYITKRGGPFVKAEGTIFNSEYTIRTVTDFVQQHHARGAEINLVTNQYEVFYKEKEREIEEKERMEKLEKEGKLDEETAVDPKSEL